MGETSGSTSVTADAESRFVALLKFDIVDSTGISNSLSPSDELDLQRAYKLAIERLLPLREARLEWEGDGGLVVFGYPEARVDAAETAVRTGLTMIDAIRQLKAVPGVALELRVGIASGRVTFDKSRAALSRVNPVSRAVRLMNHAQPGQLLIAEDTRRLARSFFEYEDLGIVELKGAGRRRVWRVLRKSSLVSRFAAQRLGESGAEIIGREEVLRALSDAWSATLEGHGSAICLVGDSGIGKSRLARAVQEWAERDGAVVLEIDCSPSAGNSPMLPVGALLSRTAGIGAGASDAEKEAAALSLLTRLLGEHAARESWVYLAPLFGVESTLIPLDKTREQVRATTIATLIAIVRAAAAQSPLAILCEDLHWADDSTTQVAQTLAARIVAPDGDGLHALPIMLIATRWPRAVTPIALDSITAAFTMIPIEPLADANAAQLVQAVARGELSPDRVDDIVGRCGGVPLLLEEVTRSTMEQADTDATVRTALARDSAVPPELQLVVESRLQQEPHLRGIIEAASVFGREFPVPALESLVAGSRDRVGAAISRFAELGLFAPPDPKRPERASFRHALIRDAVYETVVSNEYLRRLHSGAADALLLTYQGTPDASADALAHHLRIARRLHEAVKVRLAAARDAFERGAYVEATGHCEAVRGLLAELGDQAVKTDAFQWCVLRGMVETGVHGYSAEPVQLAYREAYQMFDEATGAESRYPVIRGLATASLVRGDLSTAHQYALEGLELAERSQRPDHRIDAMSVVAYTTLYFGRLGDCRVWIHRCLELYDEKGGHTFRYPVPQDAKTAALALLPTAAWLLGDAAGAEEAIARGLQHVEGLGRNFDRALLHAWTAGTRYTQRRYREALGHARTAYALGHEHKFEEWEGVGALMALLSRSAEEPAPDAVEQAVQTAKAFQARNIGLNASYFLWGIARGYVTANDFAAASTVLNTALLVAAGSGETRMNPEIWMLQSEIEPERSKRLILLRQAYDLAESQGAVANALRAAAMLVRASGHPPDLEWAGHALDLLDRRRSEPSRPLCMHDELERARRALAAMELA
jgi:class 3 adenylate cyclase/DNA replicative helicase MCM subunit Mcm2 (Cdc46/Mcm family)